MDDELKYAIRLIELQSSLLQKGGALLPDSESLERLIRIPEVLRRTGLSKRMIYRLEAEGRFPRRRKLGLRAVGWPESQVSVWITDPKGWRAAEGSGTKATR